MANKDIFEVHGAKELSKELRDLSKGMRNKIVSQSRSKASNHSIFRSEYLRLDIFTH